jgi:hypothetical protein
MTLTYRVKTADSSSSLRFVVVTIIALVVTHTSALAADTRKPHSLERAYTAMVQGGYNANLCDRISPKALNRFSFNSPGSQISYQRSECFFYAAATELNDAYCNEIIEAKAWFLDGSRFSPESCRDFVAAGKPWLATTSFNHEELLRAAGFDDTDLAKAVPAAETDIAWMQFYYSFQNHSDGRLQQRLDQLPDFSNE